MTARRKPPDRRARQDPVAGVGCGAIRDPAQPIAPTLSSAAALTVMPPRFGGPTMGSRSSGGTGRGGVDAVARPLAAEIRGGGRGARGDRTRGGRGNDLVAPVKATLSRPPSDVVHRRAGLAVLALEDVSDGGGREDGPGRRGGVGEDPLGARAQLAVE